MTVSVSMQCITSAESRSINCVSADAFDAVTICDQGHGEVRLYLPHGTGEAVAHAIRNAIQPQAVEAAE